jgi:DNA-binding transcriptional ArsR family regulator
MARTLRELKEVRKAVLMLESDPRTFLILVYFLHTNKESGIEDIKSFFKKNALKGFSDLSQGKIGNHLKFLKANGILEIRYKRNNPVYNAGKETYTLNNEGFANQYLTQNKLLKSKINKFIEYLQNDGYSHIKKLIKSNLFSRFNKVTFYVYLVDRFDDFNEDKEGFERLRLVLLDNLYSAVKFYYGFSARAKDFKEIKEEQKKMLSFSNKLIKSQKKLQREKEKLFDEIESKRG